MLRVLPRVASVHLQASIVCLDVPATSWRGCGVACDQSVCCHADCRQMRSRCYQEGHVDASRQSKPSIGRMEVRDGVLRSLRNGGLALVDAAGNTVDTWGQSVIVVADGIPALSSANPIWIQPLK
ncbi:hypothetical protein L917_01596 [Phytophthora nicotianae]|uniref:Uncharacterized protein n=1 Tax=Phytophthora nicotianae TaxID=4792 RepID=W2LZ15_PHYNI|nr:hypothetical protein L916_01631 [Phytophthora nicotianae]ETM01856.1 hypothetical protein L917_01596 [Phytophthora nicotianae]